MSKPYVHACNNVKRWGGKPEDYLPIHDWFDQTKAHLPLSQHRCVLHNSFGIFLCEQFFGHNITNSDGRLVSVRDIGEAHVLEDFGGKFIPTLQDYLDNMEIQPWMVNGKGVPPSNAKLFSKKLKNAKTIDMGAVVMDGASKFREIT